MEKKVYIIINEQHSLLPQQEKILREKFQTWEEIRIPAEGLSLQEQKELAEDLSQKASYIVFVSPIPYLLKTCAELTYKYHDWMSGEGARADVLVFHNDKREKREINGKIITTIAQDGWQLV